VYTREDVQWIAGRWRHIAFVWDAAADRRDCVRVYIDGKRAAGLSLTINQERLAERQTVQLGPTRAQSFQLGAMSSGWSPADAAVDELRISRVVRYREDFTPPRKLTLDKATTVLFHFDGELTGEGLAEDGTAYTLMATPGVVAYHP